MSAKEIVKPFIEKLLGDIEDSDLEEKAKVFCELACREWAEWAAGTYRPTSMSELNADRILKIYTRIIVGVPTVEDLVKVFSIPVGRARYLVSTLKFGNYTDLRGIIRDRLKNILEDKITDEKGEQMGDTATISLFIEKNLLEELRLIDHELAYKIPAPDGKDPYEAITEVKRSSFGAECSMTVEMATRIIGQL